MTRRGEGEASFDCGGKTWTLRMDFNAMADFQAETGKEFMATVAAMETGALAAADLRALFWAMLRDHHSDITIREAGRLVISGMAALSQAALSALPDGSAAKEGDEPGKPLAAPAQAA